MAAENGPDSPRSYDFDFVDDSEPLKDIPSPKIMRQNRKQAFDLQLDQNGNKIGGRQNADKSKIVGRRLSLETKKRRVRRNQFQLLQEAENFEADNFGADTSPAITTRKSPSKKRVTSKASPPPKRPRISTAETGDVDSGVSANSPNVSASSSGVSANSPNVSASSSGVSVSSSGVSVNGSCVSANSPNVSASSSGVSVNSSGVSADGSGDGGHVYWCRIGQEVLARWSDGLFYLGRICKVDRVHDQCLITYEDKSSFWALYKDLQNVPAKPLPIDEMVCNRCHGGDSDQPNQIVICDNCGIGYHQQCHKPAIVDSMLNSRESWHCRLCVFVSATKKGGAHKRGANAKLFSKIKLSLPYEPSCLDWNDEHLSNKQRCYCYCGGPGEWSMKMLQCRRCNQWFHEACLQSLEHPLLYGDQSYVFVCGGCNHGNEYVKRIPLDWLQIIQLALFNLSTLEEEVWFDTSAICTWIRQNLTWLQLDQTFHTLSVSTWRFHVSRKMVKHRQFVTGPRGFYGLRERAPPNKLALVLPPGPLDDVTVTEVIEKAKEFGRSSEKVKPKRGRPLKSRLSLPDDDVIRPIPRLVKVKKSASSTSSLLRHNDVTDSTMTSDTDTDVMIDVINDVKDEDEQQIDDNNNNYVETGTSETEKFGFLNRSIPYLAAFEGVRHPFKTFLEREEELRIERKKSQILAQFGAHYNPNNLTKNNFMTSDEKRRQRNLHIVEVLRKKRGRKTDKEKKILEMAEDVHGRKGSRKRKRIVELSATELVQGLQKGGSREKVQKGEECEVQARRVLPTGEVQYLILWRGISK